MTAPAAVASAGAAASGWIGGWVLEQADGAAFHEVDFFRRLEHSGARVLLIGRRALVLLGLPVRTADYDLWAHADDGTKLNEALAPLGFTPTGTPRGTGRCVDVLAARSMTTIDGVPVVFEEAWSRRQQVRFAGGVEVALPALDDLIATRRFSARPEDLTDIRLLESLRVGDGG